MARVFVGIGSNIERRRHIRAALEALQGRFGPLTCSAVYESEAVGFDGAPFFNMVVAFETEEGLASLCRYLDQLELQQGRPADAVSFTPRTLDLDLLLYGDLVVDQPGLQLPRADITRYAFVLRPLAEIAPESRHPRSGERYAALWSAFADPGQRLWRADFEPLALGA